MSAAFVLDCSLTMTWLFGEEATKESRALQTRMKQEAAVVPSLWCLEVANTLAMAERRKRSTPAQSARFLEFLLTLDIEIDQTTSARAFGHLLPLCREHGLTSYDAAYLDLAAQRRLPLATLDDDLRKCARKAGVPLLGK